MMMNDDDDDGDDDDDDDEIAEKDGYVYLRFGERRGRLVVYSMHIVLFLRRAYAVF